MGKSWLRLDYCVCRVSHACICSKLKVFYISFHFLASVDATEIMLREAAPTLFQELTCDTVCIDGYVAINLCIFAFVVFELLVKSSRICKMWFICVLE